MSDPWSLMGLIISYCDWASSVSMLSVFLILKDNFFGLTFCRLRLRLTNTEPRRFINLRNVIIYKKWDETELALYLRLGLILVINGCIKIVSSYGVIGLGDRLCFIAFCIIFCAIPNDRWFWDPGQLRLATQIFRFKNVALFFHASIYD